MPPMSILPHPHQGWGVLRRARPATSATSVVRVVHRSTQPRLDGFAHRVILSPIINSSHKTMSEENVVAPEVEVVEAQPEVIEAPAEEAVAE